jgi:hypothetical protein
MGYRGPAPKPNAIKRAEGNPGKRPLNRYEPQPRLTTPKCPNTWTSTRSGNGNG